MGSVILENLNGRKLIVLVSVLLLCQVFCFFIGALIAPSPSSVETVLATKCVRKENESTLLHVRGKNRCRSVSLYNTLTNVEQIQLANQIVYAFQLPSPRDNVVLDYSRWQQNLIGILQVDISYQSEFEIAADTLLIMDVNLGYRNYGDKEDDWKLYVASKVKRHLYCSIDLKRIGYLYNCSLIPLFELGSLHHDFYLLNIQIDGNSTMNHGLGHIEDLWLTIINQNGGFTKVWLTLKCIFLPCIICIMIWFWRRIHRLNRPILLLEYMLLFVGGTLALLNLPVEFLTLAFDIPFISLFQDIRQGIFYAALLSFWLIFAEEHLMIQDSKPHHLQTYWKHLSAVVIGCISLFIYDLSEKGAQIKNPFYSIWAVKSSTNLALIIIICAGISAAFYFIFLCFTILRVFCNVNAKKLSSISTIRRLQNEGVFYRFKFLMIATITCAALTMTGFFMGQNTEGGWKWNAVVQIEFVSGFFTGVYGMWNIYIFALIILYSPSHKRHHFEIDLNHLAGDENEENSSRMECNEISLLSCTKAHGQIIN